MKSTGIEALDARLGSLVEGRYYLLSGPSGAGKTSATLHFIGAGLEAGEVCAVLSQDDPSDMLAHSEMLGYELTPALEQDRLRILKFRLDFLRNYSRVFDADAVFHELEQLLGEPAPDRLVVDSILPFLDGGHASEEMMDAFARFLQRFPGTVYLTVPGDLDDAVYRRIYNRITAHAAGIFEFHARDGKVRELSIQKLRQPMKFDDPFRFVIRPGAGIVEEVSWGGRDSLPEEVRRRVVVLNEGGAVPTCLLPALQQKYELVLHASVESAFADLIGGLYGVLIIGVAPFDSRAAFELTRSLRKAGNGAPILFCSPSKGLRSSTRAQGLRIGGDDFLTDALSPQEILERIEAARLRGHRRQPQAAGPELVVLQPVEEGGRPRLMTEQELRRAIRGKIERGTEPFFALALIDVPALGIEEAWRVLRQRVRIKEGDLVARMEDGHVAVFFHDVGHEQAAELVTRLGEFHPALGGPAVTTFYRHPVDRTALETWLGRPEAAAAEAMVRR